MKKKCLKFYLIVISVLFAAILIILILFFLWKESLSEKKYEPSKQKIVSNTDVKRIFILNSFNLGYIWTDNMNAGINDSFKRSGLNIDTYVRFMDMKRIAKTDEYYNQYKQMLKTGYKNVKFDALIACDNDALDFLRKYRDELFPQVPLVFSSINDYSKDMLDGRNDITGTSENTDYKGTLDIALKLCPKTATIVVVIDQTTTGQAHRRAVKKIENNYSNKVTFQYISLGDYNLEELGQKLSKLPDDNIVLLLQHFRDKNGNTYEVGKSTRYLTDSASVPCFVLSDIRLGFGAIGGNVVSGYYHGSMAAHMVIKILGGLDISTMPVMLNSPNIYMFDYQVIKRFNISYKNLPSTSVIINKPVSFFETNKYTIIISSLIIMFLIIIIIILIFNMKQRKLSAIALSESEKRLRTTLENTQALLRELYHRTKNNMQVICSLINIQKNYIDNDKIKDIFTDLENRIQSMALVHQKLYESKNLAKINLRDYIIDLVNLLKKSLNLLTQNVNFDLLLNDISITLDTAIPCGLIINELITNSLKYAFKDNNKGTISITISKNPDDFIELKVSDNGTGVKKGFDFNKDGKMGIQSIIAIGEHQLRGKVSFSIDIGLSCTIIFKESTYNEKTYS